MTKETPSGEMLPFDVIAEAAKGDALALCKVLEHYDGYINFFIPSEKGMYVRTKEKKNPKLWYVRTQCFKLK